MSAIGTYRTRQKVLHWMVVALIAWQFVSSFIIDTFPDGAPEAFPFQASHGLSGLAILLLTLVRLFFRFRDGAPGLPESMTPALRILAKATHIALYVLLILQPIAGILAGGDPEGPFAPVHIIGSRLLLLVLALHVAGAIWHLIMGDGIGRRMFFGGSARSD